MPETTPSNTSGTFVCPPAGWSHFGTHLDYPGLLKFSKERDADGYPLWERPLNTCGPRD